MSDIEKNTNTRKSSIHIQAGHEFYFKHNDRSKMTHNSIFDVNSNEVDRSAEEALSLLKEELKKREEAYKKRTGQRLQKKTIRHFSAVINLNEKHTLKDVRKVADLIEKELDTRVVQIAVHRDEGHIDDEGRKIVNYHAHIEFVGIDSEGKSIKRKMNRVFLSKLQTKVADILGMERGEEGSKRKRLSAREYKRMMKELNELKKENAELKKENKELKQMNKKMLEEVEKAKESIAIAKQAIEMLQSHQAPKPQPHKTPKQPQTPPPLGNLDIDL